MIFVVRTSLVVFMLCLLTPMCPAYELQDTIHSLKEENLHLQHQLENLTHAMRDLKHLLSEYAKFSGEGQNSEYRRAWKERSQHGISPETYTILEQALCFPDLHGSALSVFNCLGLCSLLCILHVALALS